MQANFHSPSRSASGQLSPSGLGYIDSDTDTLVDSPFKMLSCATERDDQDCGTSSDMDCDSDSDLEDNSACPIQGHAATPARLSKGLRAIPGSRIRNSAPLAEPKTMQEPRACELETERMLQKLSAQLAQQHKESNAIRLRLARSITERNDLQQKVDSLQSQVIELEAENGNMHEKMKELSKNGADLVGMVDGEREKMEGQRQFMEACIEQERAISKDLWNRVTQLSIAEGERMEERQRMQARIDALEDNEWMHISQQALPVLDTQGNEQDDGRLHSLEAGRTSQAAFLDAFTMITKLGDLLDDGLRPYSES